MGELIDRVNRGGADQYRIGGESFDFHELFDGLATVWCIGRSGGRQCDFYEFDVETAS